MVTQKLKTEHFYRILRSAIDDNYVPQSIKSLKYVVMIIIMMLISMSWLFFSFELQMYDNFHKVINDYYLSEKRFNYVLESNL